MDTYYLQELQELNHSRYKDYGFKNYMDFENKEQIRCTGIDGLKAMHAVEACITSFEKNIKIEL